MAIIQLGVGDQYEGKVIAATRMYNGDDEEPSQVTIFCSTDQGDSQKNFPITLTLDRQEALRLITGISSALIFPEPPKVKKFEGGQLLESRDL